MADSRTVKHAWHRSGAGFSLREWVRLVLTKKTPRSKRIAVACGRWASRKGMR